MVQIILDFCSLLCDFRSCRLISYSSCIFNIDFVLIYTAQRLANISGVGEIVEKFSRWIMAVIYIGLGLFIIIENNTIQTIIGFIF